MTYGLQIFDEYGNVMLDTSDNTLKDIAIYVNSSITSNGEITGVTLPADAIVLVTNNSTVDTTRVPDVIVDPANSKIIVQNGGAGFDVGVRVMEW